MNDPPIMANAISCSDETTILVVEDEIMVRAMLSDGLRREGHNVIEAANADEAVAVLRSHISVDLVITDMQMPGSMDGPALVRLIRTEHPFVKVIMVSGQPPDDATLEQLHGYLQKPVIPSQLIRYLQKFIPSSAGLGSGA